MKPASSRGYEAADLRPSWCRADRLTPARGRSVRIFTRRVSSLVVRVMLEAVVRGASRSSYAGLLGIFLGLERVGLTAGADADTCFRIRNLIPRSGSVTVAAR